MLSVVNVSRAISNCCLIFLFIYFFSEWNEQWPLLFFGRNVTSKLVRFLYGVVLTVQLKRYWNSHADFFISCLSNQSVFTKKMNEWIHGLICNSLSANIFVSGHRTCWFTEASILYIFFIKYQVVISETTGLGLLYGFMCM